MKAYLAIIEGCAPCEIAKELYSLHSDEVEVVGYGDLPDGIKEQVVGERGDDVPFPLLIVVLSSGEVLMTAKAVSGEEPTVHVSPRCALCGREDGDITYCSTCRTYLCSRCRKRWFARAKASVSKLVRGYWIDDTGAVRN